jgi:hypothetical protein
MVRNNARAEEAAMKRKTYPQGHASSPFTLLNGEHQRSTVLRLADSRVSDHSISTLTGLDVVEVRRIIAARAAAIQARDEVSP